MLGIAVTTSVVALSYLCQHPDLIGKAGIYLHLRDQSILAWVSKQAYRTLAKVYELVHQIPPKSSTDELARFMWLDRDAELVVRVQEAIHELTDLQSTEVPVSLPTPTVYADLFHEVKSSYSEFNNWHDLGFQGQNPATDFRGVGKLGVLLLHGFCTSHTVELQRLVLESRCATENAPEQQWYPLALVSIRLSMALCEVLKREKLLVVRLLQQTSPTHNLLQVVQKVHDQLLLDFHELWLVSVNRGEVKTYFGNEAVLKTFEQNLPLRIYNLRASEKQ